MFRFMVILIALAPALVFGVAVDKCAGGEPEVLGVTVVGCDAQPCKLIRGQNSDMTMDFTAAFDTSKNLKTEVVAYALGTTAPFPLPDDQANTCGRLTAGSCPLDEGEDATYHMVMPVLKEYPLVDLVLQISIVDGDRTISCFKIDAITADA